MKTIDTLIANGRANPASFERVMKDLNEKFRADGARTSRSTDPISLSALARHIHYVGLARAEAKRKRTATHLRPRWTEIIHLYDEFRKRVGPGLFLDTNIKNQDVMRLCSFDTYRQGAGGDTFYSSLALFVVDLAEREELASGFVNFALPRSDWDLTDAVSRYLLEDEKERSSVSAPEFAQERGLATKPSAGQTYPEVTFKFSYVPSKLADLRSFHERFRSDYSDLAVHFICYRPRKSDPTELMKTFLAVKPPHDGESKSFNFVHIYQAPETKTKQRIALGKVLPLHEGLYLVGGQMEVREPKPPGPMPFRTLKVISLAWRSIEYFEHLLSGLVMSANNQGQHIVSRIILKATPLDHSSRIDLGSIGLKDLEKDLTKDMKKEIDYLERQGAPESEFKRYELQQEEIAATARNLAKKIVDGTNNDPSIWDIVGSTPSTKARRPGLTKALISRGLEQKFGSDGNPSYQDSFGGDFDFWSSVRFGVLARKT